MIQDGGVLSIISGSQVDLTPQSTSRTSERPRKRKLFHDEDSQLIVSLAECTGSTIKSILIVPYQ